MKQEIKSQLKREAIVTATISLVNSRGYHATPIAKLAQLANVSPGTIYLYFENKQDLLNKAYLEVKGRFTKFSFANYSADLTVEENYKEIWHRIAEYKLNHIQDALFLGQCDNTPIIDEAIRQEGIILLAPLVEIIRKGISEGILKNMSDYLFYAYSITPISFLIVMQDRDSFNISKTSLDAAYKAAWDSIKI